MGLTKKQCEALGIGNLFPKPKATAKGKRKPSHVRGQMNRTEARYAEILEAQRLLGEIKSWTFEEDTLAIGPEMKFTPDFRVELLSGDISYIDVKGAYIYEDATCKIKAAAALYPQYRFSQAKWTGRSWKIREFRSGREESSC